MDGAALITSLARESITLVRRVEPVLDTTTGVYEEQAPAETRLEPVVVHTLSGRDLLELPEADRNTEMVQVYATKRLFAADDGKHAADRLRYHGRTFRVTKVFDEAVNGGVFMAYASLEEPGVTP